jgi:hypothetical protein
MHESPPPLPWANGDCATLISDRLGQLHAHAENCRIVGDVAFYYLNYVPAALEIDPSLRVVCLRRPQREVVVSYRRWISRNFGPHVSHWAAPGHGWQEDPLWGPCYPKYELTDMNAAIARFWDEYYSTVEELRAKYSDRIAMFEMQDALNTEAG